MRLVTYLLIVTAQCTLPPALAQEGAVIAGTGATSCSQYLSDIGKTPAAEREYFAWAQGFLSGLLIRSPAGEHVDLKHRALPYPDQMVFIRNYCQANTKEPFDAGVLELYKTLRKHSAQGRT